MSLQQKLDFFQESHHPRIVEAIVDKHASPADVHFLSVFNNRIHIDRGLMLAAAPNGINDSWVTRSSPADLFLNEQILKLKDFLSLQRFSEKKYRAKLDCLLANLLNARNTRSQLIYNRRHDERRDTIQVLVIDYLEHSGFVYNVIGKNNEYQGNASWLIPTRRLELEFERSRTKVALAGGLSMLVLRDKDGKDKQIKTGKRPVALTVERLSKSVRAYNEIWLDHTATLDTRELVPFCRRVFNRHFDLGGRFYGASHQNLSHALREQILIDGEETTEPDFKAIHYCLMYAQEGIQLDPTSNDPYQVPGFSRQTMKLASLVLMNINSLDSFKRIITKSGNPAVKSQMDEYAEKHQRFIKRSSQGLPTKQPYKPSCAQGYIAGIPDHTNGSEVLDGLLNKHSAIAHRFGSPDLGLTLQFLDSQIMGDCLHELSKTGTPVLPVHDSIRCRKSDETKVRKIMERSYQERVKFNGFLG